MHETGYALNRICLGKDHGKYYDRATSSLYMTKFFIDEMSDSYYRQSSYIKCAISIFNI